MEELRSDLEGRSEDTLIDRGKEAREEAEDKERSTQPRLTEAKGNQRDENTLKDDLASNAGECDVPLTNEAKVYPQVMQLAPALELSLELEHSS